MEDLKILHLLKGEKRATKECLCKGSIGEKGLTVKKMSELYSNSRLNSKEGNRERRQQGEKGASKGCLWVEDLKILHLLKGEKRATKECLCKGRIGEKGLTVKKMSELYSNSRLNSKEGNKERKTNGRFSSSNDQDKESENESS